MYHWVAPIALMASSFVNSQQLVLGGEIDLHAALFVSSLDRLHDHRVGSYFRNDQRRHAFLNQAEWRATAGLAHGGARERHDVID